MFCVALCGVLWMFDGKQKIGSVPRAAFLLMDAFYDISYNWFRYSKCFILFVFCLSGNFLYIRNIIHDSLVVQTEDNWTKNLGKLKKVLSFESTPASYFRSYKSWIQLLSLVIRCTQICPSSMSIYFTFSSGVASFSANVLEILLLKYWNILFEIFKMKVILS